MSAFWEQVNADYVARGGVPQPEIWPDYKGPKEKPKGRGKGQPRGLPQHWDHGRPRNLSPRQESEAAARYAAGEPSPALGREYGVGPNAILRAVRSVGGEVRTRKTATRLAKSRLLAPEQEIELVRGYADDLKSVRDLSVIFGIGKSAVYRILQDHKVPTRSIAQAQKIAKQRNPRWSPEQARMLRRRYEGGASLADLVREYGGARTGITSAIISAGGTIRDRATAIRMAKANTQPTGSTKQ